MNRFVQQSINAFLKRAKQEFDIDMKQDWIEFDNEPGPVFFCIHTFNRNPRKGDVCGKKLKKGEYCSLHKAKEAKETKETKKVKSIDNSVAKEKTEVVGLNYKLGKYIHQPTKLAFYSKEHKIVYGKLSLQDTIIQLCDKDISLCKQYMFRYDLNLFK